MEIKPDKDIFEADIIKTGRILYNSQEYPFQVSISIQNPEIYYDCWIDQSESEFPMSHQEMVDMTAQLKENFKLKYKLTDTWS